MLTYDARIKLVSLNGERTLDLKEFHTGPNKTVMADNEILTEIEFDALPSHTSSAFEKTARVGADISKITCAVTVAAGGQRLQVLPHRLRSGRTGAHADTPGRGVDRSVSRLKIS